MTKSTAYGFTGFDFSGSAEGERATTFGDLFEDVFTRRATHSRPTAPSAAPISMSRSCLRSTTRGAASQWPVSVARQDTCRSCAGSGVHRTVDSRCAACEGTGVVRSVRGHMVFSKNCPHCNGSGRLRQLTCETCHGQGVEDARKPSACAFLRASPTAPESASPGRAMRACAVANPATSTSTWRSQRIRCSSETTTICTCVVPIAIHEAALGARIDIPTPDGPMRLRVPPGTQSGQRFRFRERGVLSARSAARGDLVVEVRIVLPRLLDERSKELLRDFGRINGESVRDASAPTCVWNTRTSGRRRADSSDDGQETGKAYYMISAVAQNYNIHPQTLRLYEREGLLAPSRTEGNTRLYSEDDLDQLETILSLTRDLGVNLAGVEIILNMRRKMERMQRKSTSSWNTSNTSSHAASTTGSSVLARRSSSLPPPIWSARHRQPRTNDIWRSGDLEILEI